jgi:integrase
LGLEYTTLNSYRSAISAYHPEIDGVKVGKHPMISQLLRGVFNRKPPKPRYLETWDVNIVLEYIKTMGIDLSLKDLTLKLAMLLALTTVARTSELHKLDPSWISDNGDRVIFHIIELTKTKRPSKPQLTITVHTYPHDKLLDVLSCLRLYLTKTEKFRHDTNQKQRLFLSLNKPYKPVTACTIARWLKILMAKAGVDTSIFKAHSTRAASTSKAKTQGVSTSQIVKCANWARATTFEKFYHKKIVTIEQNYQNVVLAL